MLFCLTSMVEHLNPTKSSRVSNVVDQYPLQLKNFILITYHNHTKKNACPINKWLCWKLMFGCCGMPRWHLHNRWWTSLGNNLKTFIGHESSTNASNILVVSLPSHNVIVSQNIVVGSKLDEANVVTKNNDVQHTILVTPNTLLRILALERKKNNCPPCCNWYNIRSSGPP
jgi:hypothetical protein